MRKFIYAVAALMFFIVPAGNGSMASATEGFYLGIQGGINDVGDTATGPLNLSGQKTGIESFSKRPLCGNNP